jgi:hypothetical protein
MVIAPRAAILESPLRKTSARGHSLTPRSFWRPAKPRMEVRDPRNRARAALTVCCQESFSLTSSGLYNDENPKNDGDERHGNQQMPYAETPSQPGRNARVHLAGQFQLLELQIANLDE